MQRYFRFDPLYGRGHSPLYGRGHSPLYGRGHSLLYGRGHSRKLLAELPGCAWRALRLYYRAWYGGPRVVPGAVGFLQTAGELLGWHPHLHVLLTDGGWLPDGTSRRRRLTWLCPQSYWGSQLIRKVNEIDPLLCPYCGAQLEIAVPPASWGAVPPAVWGAVPPAVWGAVPPAVWGAVPPAVWGVAFVVDWVSLRRLLTHLGFAPQQPESLAHAPPHDAQPLRAHA